MPKKQGKRTISRRGALSVISGSVCAAINLPRSGGAATWIAAPGPGIPRVAGDARDAVFTKPQMETIAALSEVIIPTDQHSPGAKAARVDQYIQEVVGASDAATKEFWIDGLSAINKLATGQHCTEFTNCNPKQQAEMLQKLSLGEGHPTTLEERFFVAVKHATVDGYYNSEVGIHEDLQYQGNTMLGEFPGCAHQSHAPGRTADNK